MNYEREQPDPDDAALDALLAEARWPEPDPANTRRLARFYRSQRSMNPARRWLLAASVLLACGLAVVVIARFARKSPAPPTQIVVVVPSPQVPNAPPEMTTQAPIPGRAPTALELARLTVAERDKRRPKPAAPEPSAVERAVMIVSKNASPDALATASDLLRKAEPARVQRELVAIALSSDRVRSRAAAELISARATADSLPLLLQLDRVPIARDAAVTGLARLAGPEMLADLVRSHTDVVHRRQLVAALIRSPRGAVEYLSLVADPATSQGALAALDGINSPPTDAFFTALRDPHVSVRLAAAKVLGRIDGPATTARLVALTERNDCRREALIALADSRGPEARQFLQEAKIGGPLAGAVRSILIDPSIHQ